MYTKKRLQICRRGCRIFHATSENTKIATACGLDSMLGDEECCMEEYEMRVCKGAGSEPKRVLVKKCPGCYDRLVPVTEDSAHQIETDEPLNSLWVNHITKVGTSHSSQNASR